MMTHKTPAAQSQEIIQAIAAELLQGSTGNQGLESRHTACELHVAALTAPATPEHDTLPPKMTSQSCSLLRSTDAKKIPMVMRLRAHRKVVLGVPGALEAILRQVNSVGIIDVLHAVPVEAQVLVQDALYLMHQRPHHLHSTATKSAPDTYQVVFCKGWC